MQMTPFVLLLFAIVFCCRFGGGDPAVLKDLVAAGMMGRKTGKGCYLYTGEKGERPLNTAAADIFKKHALEPIADVSTDLDIQQRLVVRFVNEAAMSLQVIGALPVTGDQCFDRHLCRFTLCE
jgi:enoyl-CoA hydratase/long-chain 3-hydroxyacyl-CoA dehydrogenase